VSPEQLVAVLTGVAAVLGAVGVVLGQVVALRRQLNGRMDQLLEATARSSHAEGLAQGQAESKSTESHL